MKKYDKLKVLLFCTLVFPFVAAAQQITASKFILPDGREITQDRLDSVKKAWNGERILFQHNAEDDKHHVMHLVRMTPEMAKTLEDIAEKSQKAMASMMGQAAPDFTLEDIAGKSWTLSRLKGKVVVLNFWFTSCPPCLQEMPQLNDLVKKYRNNNVVFLGITFNDKKNVGEFLKDHLFRYTLLPSSGKVDKAYQISSWPTSFAIGMDGRVKSAMHADEHIFATLSNAIDRALQER